MGADNGKGSFFEVSLDTGVYTDLFAGENELLDSIMDQKKLFARLTQDSRFYSIIAEMYRDKTGYSGKLKKLYLESKAMELLLIQMSCLKNGLENGLEKKRVKFLNRDIEAIHQVKSLLETNLEHISIPRLALLAGVSQTKLKVGFKELFGTTVFEYLTSVRMSKACELLKETDLTIAEIAEMVGYRYAQHFSSAFQKTFGYLPSSLRK